MEHKLPELPYAKEALAPLISKETLEYHYGKHHNTYVTNLNKLIKGTEFENAELDAIVKSAKGPVFNNAAQHWNHSFYWKCLKPVGTGAAEQEILPALEKQFGSFAKFREDFTAAAVSLFGSGWVWLVDDSKGNLSIISKPNAGNPLTEGQKPLLVVDVWEHAYYIDYRNARATYMESFWKLVNWEFVDSNYAG